MTSIAETVSERLGKEVQWEPSKEGLDGKWVCEGHEVISVDLFGKYGRPGHPSYEERLEVVTAVLKKLLAGEDRTKHPKSSLLAALSSAVYREKAEDWYSELQVSKAVYEDMLAQKRAEGVPIQGGIMGLDAWAAEESLIGYNQNPLLKLLPKREDQPFKWPCPFCKRPAPVDEGVCKCGAMSSERKRWLDKEIREQLTTGSYGYPEETWYAWIPEEEGMLIPARTAPRWASEHPASEEQAKLLAIEAVWGRRRSGEIPFPKDDND